MKLYEFINNINFFFNSKLFLVEEFVVLLLFYNFVKLIVFGSLLELLWPTQFFNRRHSSNYSLVKIRTFTETVLKLRRRTPFYKIFNRALYKYRFFKKK